jgi:hypothetical protein
MFLTSSLLEENNDEKIILFNISCSHKSDFI